MENLIWILIAVSTIHVMVSVLGILSTVSVRKELTEFRKQSAAENDAILERLDPVDTYFEKENKSHIDGFTIKDENVWEEVPNLGNNTLFGKGR